MSYIIPKDECTLSEQRAFKEAAMQAGILRAVDKIGGAADEYVAREIAPIAEAGAAGDWWATAVLTVAGNAYSCFQAIASPTLAANKMAVFYGVAITTAPVPVSRLRFRHAGIAGNVLAVFDLDRIANGNTVEGYFSQPVPWDPNQQITVEVVASIATGALCRVVLWNWLIEPVGPTIG